MRPLFLILFILIITAAQAQVRLNLDNVIELDSEIEYFIDPTGQMSLDQVKGSEAFRTSPEEGLRLNDVTGNLWLRIVLFNPYTDVEKSILIFDDPSLFEIILYEEGEPEALSGSSAEPELKDVPGNHNAFEVETEGLSQEVLYVRIHSENFITATASLYSDDLYHERALREHIFLGLFYGVMLLITLYSIFLYVLTRMKAFLIYAAYIVANMLFTGMLDGFTPLYMHSLVVLGGGYLEYILAAIANAIGLLFMAHFLKLREWSRALFTFSKYLGILIIAVLILVLVAIPEEGFEIFRPVGILTLAAILLVSFRGLQKGVDQSGFFLFAFVSYGIFILLFIMNLFRMVPFSFVVKYSLHFGILMNLVILSLALGVRVYRRYRNIIDEQRAEKELITIKNTELENLVWERTKTIIYRENEVRSIIDNSDNLIWLVDKDYILREMNRGFADSWEQTFHTTLKKGRNILEQIPTEKLRKLWKSRYDKIFSGRQESFSESYDINGDIRYFEINAFPVTEGDRVNAAALFSREITERVKYEQELMDKNQALEKVNRELDSFVYSASHDLKAPLASIQGLIGLVREEKQEDQRNIYYDMMDRSIRRLDQFIRDIIDYSRNTRSEAQKEVIDINDLVNSILDDLRYMNPTDKTEIKLVPDAKTELIGDPIRIRIILRNLLSNAIRYGHYEGREPKVEIRWKIRKKKAVFEIRDNGPGIAPEHIGHIFDMFYRAHESSSGSGLGLYIVKETLDKMNGSIHVESEPGEGTSFVAELPNYPSTE